MRPVIVDCQTAEDVRKLAKRVKTRRREFEAELARKNAAAIAAAAPAAPAAPAPPAPPTEEQIVDWIKRHRSQARELFGNVEAAVEADEEEAPRAPRLSEVVAAVCRQFQVTRADLVSQRRNKVVCAPRQISMLLCRILTHNSLPAIGHYHGGRDHTTVMHAINRLAWLKVRLEEELTHDHSTRVWARRAAIHFVNDQQELR